MKTNNAIQPTLPPALRYRRTAMVLAALFTACFSLLTPATAQTITSAVPGFISYQGKVLNSSGGLVGAGTPVNRTVTFRIWDHASNTLATNLLYSEQQTVTISEGEFSVLVGQGVFTAGSPLGYSESGKGPPTITVSSLSVFAGPSRYLGVTVDDGTAAVDNEITPRQQIVSSAFALRAKYAESLGSNGATSLTALDSGNVGIGNTNPPSLFTITGANTSTTTNTPQLVITDTTDQNERLLFGVDSTGNSTGFIQATKVGTGAQNLLLNPNGGNVGIGNASPTAKLDVTGGIKATGAGGYTFNTGDLDGGLFSPADGVVTLNTNGSERVRVDGSGNVGIGNNAPDNLLAIGTNISGGNLNGLTMGAAANRHIAVGQSASNSIYMKWAYNATAANAYGTLATFGGNNPLVLQEAGGNVGIGTTSPVSKLEVNGSMQSQSLELRANASTPFLDFSGNNSADYHARIIYMGTADDRLEFAATKFSFSTGNVGIGTSSPSQKLDVAGNCYFASSDNAAFVVDSSGFGRLGIVKKAGSSPIIASASGNDIVFGQSNQGSLFTNVATSTITEYMKIQSGGNVGIGTASPSYAKLVINGGPSQTGLSASYLQSGGGSFTAVGHAAHIFSIYATGGIRSDDGFYASSDARMKIIEGVSDGGADLRSLLSIEVTNYRYRDKVAKGESVQKKVVAQQVEKVYPQAVSRVTNVLPDIYQKAVIKEGWIMLKTDLKKGEHVRLIDNQSTNLFEVLEVKEGKFRTAFESQGDEVFVYGREVNDFRVVDYEAISMLNVSATQQIKKEKDAEVKALQDENTSLKDQLEAQSKQLAELQAKEKARDAADKARDAKLAAIEKALESAGKPAMRTAALKKGHGAE